MSFAKILSTPTKLGRGRFQVSEGTAPAEKILPDEDLLTLFQTVPGQPDQFFEVVLTKGTIISTYQKTDTRYVATYCRGMSGYVLNTAQAHSDTRVVSYKTAGETADADNVKIGEVWAPDDTNFIDNANGIDGVAGSLGQASHPIGVLAKDAFRPFDKGDSEGCTFITEGYVEWPLVSLKASNDAVIFDNSNVVVGNYVKPDPLGRPVKWNPGEPEDLKIGQVIARELLTGAMKNYDYGFLNYMQLPFGAFDTALVAAASTVTVFDQLAYFGVRTNIDSRDALAWDAMYPTMASVAKYGAVGAIRVNLINM